MNWLLLAIAVIVNIIVWAVLVYLFFSN